MPHGKSYDQKMPFSLNAWKKAHSVLILDGSSHIEETGKSLLTARLSLNSFRALCNIELGSSEEMVDNIIFVNPNHRSLCVYRCVGAGISQNS